MTTTAKFTHTPGPWVISTCDDTLILARSYHSIAWKACPEDVDKGRGVFVATVEYPTWAHPERIGDDETHEAFEAEYKANARLIAAAPAMYEAAAPIAAIAARLPEWALDVSAVNITVAQVRALAAALSLAEPSDV